MRELTWTSLIVAVLLAGCASAGPPVAPEQQAEAEAAVRAAEAAGAAESAPELLRQAHEALTAAGDSANDISRQRLVEAKAYAEAAEAKARAEGLRDEAERVRREADALEAQTRQFREQAPPPR